MRTRLAVFLSLAALAGCMAASSLPQEGPREAAETALKDRAWAKAAALLNDALAAAKTGQDEILYLLAIAHQQGGRHDDAIAALDRLVKDHAASPLRMKALFKKGDVLAAKKEFALASQIYDTQVAAITAPERRKKLAMIYVEAGREFLVPKDAKDPTFVPNHVAAHNLLAKALDLEALGTDEEAVRVNVIECELKGQFPRPQLLKTCETFEEKFAASTKLDEVLFAKGTALRDTGRPWEAQIAWVRVADGFAASKKAPEALYAAALLHVGESGETFDVEALRRGLPLLRRLSKDFASSEQGPKAALLVGLALGRYEDLRDDARKELLAFSETKHERAPEALLRVAQLHLEDQDDAKAIATYEDFLKRFPDSAFWPQVRAAIADIRFVKIDRAARKKDWALLRTAVQEFTAVHAADGRAVQAELRIGESFKEEKKFKEAVESWMKVAAKYPSLDDGHRARYFAAEQMAAELDDFETALKELPKVQGSMGVAATQLIQRLKDKALAAESEKVFTSGEAPAVKLTTRNVEKVKLRVWALDLKDYFEKKASTSGLLGLEVAVIAPDKEWEIDIKDYKKFKEIKSSIELPKKDPGAYVVTASAGAIESTTVVVVSDLGLIARAGRKGATIIVENLKTGSHEAKAVVRTAADGRHLKAWAPETIASKLSFLAESNGHLAFRDLDVGALPVSPERKPMALILTDRRAYAPEDEVKVRIIARDVADNAFVLGKEKRVRFVAVSAQGVTFFEDEVALSAAGTAGTTVRLPAGIGGNVRIDVIDAAKPQEKWLGNTFVRIAIAAPRVRHFDTIMDDKPVFAGDPVDVTVILRDAYGRPMANRRVNVRRSQALPFKDVMTGADGAFVVAVRDTDAYYRGGTAIINVEHEGVEDFIPIPVLPKGVRLSFDPVSRIGEPLFSGDRKTLTVVAKRADDSVVEGTFAWRIVRENVAGEREHFAKGDVTTNKEGKGEIEFTAGKGGVYTVTVLVKDADGMPLRTQGALAVYDDKDERKVRLVSKADEFEPGKAMEFEVVSLLEEGLAFVTVEGEKVEQVVAVTLEKGRTTVKLAAPPASTRDFTVAVLMMQANKFHADVRDFRLKAPEIKIDLKKEVKPGEEITVKVTATPGAEVILAAAERVTTAIDPAAFRAARPGAHFLGDSSAATAFAGRTQQLDEQLVQAMARLKELEKSADRVNMPSPEEAEFRQRDERQMEENKYLRGKPFDSIGSGGGGGGRYGGRLGGKRPMELAELPPIAFMSAVAGADGVATFTFRVPQGWDTYQVHAYAVDGTNAIAVKTETFKARAPVTVEFRAPASAFEGELTSVVALLTNRTSQEQEATINGEKVKVAARSTLEKDLSWTAASSVSFTLDGVKQEQSVALRPEGPTTWNETGGAFTGKKELTLDGEGKIHARAMTGPVALFEALAEGRDDLTPASDAAAKLIALMARHRYAKSDATKRAVMEFAARRAAGLSDAAVEETEWPVLVYLAAAEAKSSEFEISPDPALLKQRFAQATTDDVKALILFALARGGEAPYGYVHRLWRASETLSPRALACVALALHAAKKTDEAKAAVERLVKLVKDDPIVVFAIAEIDPTNAILPQARAGLLLKWPSTPFDRAMVALAMQSTPDKSAVTAVKVTAGDKVIAEPTGDGTYYLFAKRSTGKAPPTGIPMTSKIEWPALIVDGVTIHRVEVTTKEPVENPVMMKVAAGESFVIKYELKVSGPTTRYQIVEFPRITGLIVDVRRLRVLVPPQQEAEKKIEVDVLFYADAPGVSGGGWTILPAGSDYRQEWKITHAERLGAGRVLFGKKKWKETREMLAPLFEKGTLRDEALAEAARMMAYSGIELAEHDTVVKYFEILKEKSPAEVVPFDKIRGVGKAYAAVNEHERAMQVHSGTCDAYFLQEANLVGALEELGRTRQAAERMKLLLLDHPDTALTREMLFGLGQRLYTAARSHRDGEKDEKKLTKAEMLAESTSSLERYLAWYPAETDGDRVALTLGSAYLEAGKHELAEKTGRLSASRWPKSKFVDSYDYTQTVALFGQKKFAEALVLCERLETFDYGRAANPGPGVMRELAVVMKAQIHHAKGDLDKALENYKKVRATQPDAERSIAFLEREAIAVPEVTIAPMAKGAEIELEYAGVTTAQVRAYKVDLAMLAMRHRGLTDAASIEVAGFKPVFEKSFTLDAPNAKRREKQRLALELKEPGAYLVGIKAGDFFASGLVLRSNLSMTVQEDGGGLVRVNVANAATGSFAEGVKVTIFGTEDRVIASEKTDLRGIWERDGVRGLAVVVAEKDGHVAMYRGQSVIGMRPAPQPREQERKAKERNADALDEQIRGANEQYEKNYKGNVQKKQEGVEVERTKK